MHQCTEIELLTMGSAIGDICSEGNVYAEDALHISYSQMTACRDLLRQVRTCG